MRHIKKFESYESKVAEKHTKNDSIQSIKRDLVSKMGHNPIDVWYGIDDRLINLKDKFGSFVDEYNSTRPVIDFDDIDIEIDISGKAHKPKDDTASNGQAFFLPAACYYSLANISNYRWRGGEKIELKEATISYSVYSSSFDDEFLKYYEKYKYSKTDALKPFYSIVIWVDSYYMVNDDTRTKNTEKYSDIASELGKEILSAIKRIPYTTKIKSIEYYDDMKHGWFKLPPSFNSLMELKHPRVKVSFFVD